jgi:hypothetical protein
MRCHLLFSIGFLVAVLFCSSVFAGNDDPQQPAQPAPLILSSVVPQGLPSDALGEIYQRWGGLFSHTPFDHAGFNAMSLPFHYRDPERLGDPAEAQAFAFLLSNDLDWAPGCYCARHAYFVFKESPVDMKALVDKYTPDVIAQLTQYWGATHALGGTLVRAKDGYTAQVVIYDRTGAVVWRKSYPVAQSYWTLLGTVDANVMAFLGEKPSDALAAYLCMPRCKRMDSLVSLGNAAFLPRLSNEEFAIYEDILSKDRDFAEVRHWWSDQKAWADGDWEEESRQTVLTLRARLSPVDLTGFSLRGDPSRVAEYARWIEDVGKLCGEDHPLTLDGKVRLLLNQPAKSPELLARAVKAAQRWPNANFLLLDLASAYSTPEITGRDEDMTASLLCASVQNFYVPGLGKGPVSVAELAIPMETLGYYDIAAQLLINDAEPTPQSEADIIWCLTQLGQFDVALYCCEHFTGNVEVQFYLLPDMVFLAGMTHSRQVLTNILERHGDYLQKTNGQDVVDWFLARMDGKVPGNSELLQPKTQNGPFATDRIVIQFEEDMRLGTSRGLPQLNQELQRYPNMRLGWIMKDRYERQSPSADAADFYQSLQWLYGDDPWVQSAVADWNSRSEGSGVKPSDPLATLEMFKELNAQLDKAVVGKEPANLSPKASPWVAAAGVKHFIDARKFNEARELAAQFRDLAQRTRHYITSAFAIHLLHLADFAGTN